MASNRDSAIGSSCFYFIFFSFDKQKLEKMCKRKQVDKGSTGTQVNLQRLLTVFQLVSNIWLSIYEKLHLFHKRKSKQTLLWLTSFPFDLSQ